jgi:tryptophan halogenase
MHYDTPRADTEFWKYAQTIPMSEKYQELKMCWQHRSPRNYDFLDHEMDKFSHFGVFSWFTIGQALGHIGAEVTANELVALSAEEKQKLIPLLSRIKSKLN